MAFIGDFAAGARMLLDPGVHPVQVPVDAQPLRAAGSGPYTVRLTLHDYRSATLLALDSFTTPAWNASDFEGPDVEIGHSVKGFSRIP